MAPATLKPDEHHVLVGLGLGRVPFDQIVEVLWIVRQERFQ